MYKVKILILLAIISLAFIGCTEKDDKDESLQPINREAEEDKDTKPEKETEQSPKQENESEPVSENTMDDENIKIDPLPTTYKELAALEVGVDAGPLYPLGEDTEVQEKKIAERFKDLPLPEGKNPSKKEMDYFFRELLKRVQLDFEGPEDLVKEMKFQSLGNPQIEDSRYQFKENLNVVIILDASGSMAGIVDGKTKMNAAKDAITDFLSKLPKEANVALRVYGHKGTGSDSDKKLSCSSTELMYGFQPYEDNSFKQALDKIKPAGWTPTGLALSEAQKDLASFKGKNNTNIVYLVSDGIETCDSQPVDAAKQLYESDITPIINVLGFGVGGKGQNHLKSIANAADGIYQTVSDQNELVEELNKVNEIAEAWKEWKEDGMQSIESKKLDNGLKIFGYITNQNANATDEMFNVRFVIWALNEHGYLSDEAEDYLLKKNKEYHAWIKSEIDQFEKELEALSEKSYKEAKKALEEKYEINTQ